MWLCKHLKSNLLTMENLIAKDFSSLAADSGRCYQKMKVGLAPGSESSQGSPITCPSPLLISISCWIK